ncbi:SET domain-containing protein-lysine N-methyltransferase [Marinobacter sp. JSM 1782161]|uniref:SET domain-containing protein-lysine N-methyltransferase n=1 Tax=Marinobacter sp. JSM 1782161 TaxID=2685906 RepID=UPI00140424C8|nr:SET domain-containing protein [Marinobacter sp. JSM 1782161]
MFSDVIDNIRYTRIASSTIHGHGLFCITDLEAGLAIAELDGQVVPWSLHETQHLTSEWNALPGNRLLVRPYKTRYFYINHARTPNLKLERLGDDRIRIVTLRFIREGEELTLDYRSEPLPDDYLSGHGATYL